LPELPLGPSINSSKASTFRLHTTRCRTTFLVPLEPPLYLKTTRMNAMLFEKYCYMDDKSALCDQFASN